MKSKLLKSLSFVLATSLSLSTPLQALAYNTDTNGNSIDSVEYQTSSDEGFENASNVFAEIGSEYKITIPKILVLSGVNKTAKYTVKAEGDIAGCETIYAVPEDNFLLYSKNKDPQTAIVQQDRTSWTYSQIKAIANGTVTANNITAGKWTGTFNFNIELNKVAGDIILPGHEHTWELIENIPATCTTMGVQKYKCPECKSTKIENINATGHKEKEAVKENEVPTTCIQKGSYDEVVYCENCGKELKRNTIIDETTPLKHNYVNDKCSVCGKEIETWRLDKGELPLIGYTTDDTNKIYKDGKEVTSVTIPAYLEYEGDTYKINAIGSSTFENFKTLETVIMPDTIKNINYYAFKDCTSLKEIKLPDSLTSIDFNAFSGCSSLTSLTIPQNVTRIGSSAIPYTIKELTFKNPKHWYYTKTENNETKKVYIDVSTSEAAVKEFSQMYTPNYYKENYECDLTGHVYEDKTIEPTCTTEGYDAKICKYCKDTIKSNIKPALGHNFVNEICTRCGRNEYEEVALNDDVLRQLGYTVTSKSGYLQDPDKSIKKDGVEVTSLVIPETYTYNGEKYRITSLEDPKENGILSRTLGAFEGSKIENVVLPKTITRISDSAFKDCKNLKTYTLPEQITEIGDDAFKGCTSLETINLNDGLKYIGKWAFSSTGLIFYFNNKISVINLPDSVETIDDYAFSGAPLKELNISNNSNLKHIGKDIFTLYPSDNYITTINLPNSLESIDNDAFASSQIENLYIPKNVKSIGYGILNTSCAKTITVDPNNKYYDSRNNCNAVIETKTNKLVTGIKTTVIPNTVQTIGKYALQSTENIAIPNSVTTIEAGAFKKCQFNNLYIPENVSTIEKDAFSSCTIQNITVDPNNKYYDSRNNCNALIETNTNTLLKASNKETTIPNGIITIGNNAFYEYDGNSISIPDSVTSIGNGAFSSCTKFTSVTIPDSVTEIGNSAFDSCSNITSIKLPKNLKTLKVCTFSNCTNLKTVTLNDSLENIEYGAFDDCSKLETMNIPDNIQSIHNDFIDYDTKCVFTYKGQQYTGRTAILNAISGK